MEKVFQYIHENEQRFMDDLFKFLRCRSISAQNDGVSECAELLRDMMIKAGIKTTIYPTARHPVVYGEIITDPELPTLLIYGHYDVQPPEPYELWHSDPFEPEIRNGYIYARGVSDNKSQLFAHVKGVEAYLNTYGKLPVNMKYLFEGEEEIGSPNLEPFCAANKELLKSDLVVMSDSHVHETGKPMLILGLKGLVYLQITLRGANRDVHSMKGSVIPSPMWRMVSLLNSIRGEDGFIKVEGFYDDVRPLLPLEVEAINKIPVDNDEIMKDLDIDHFLMNRTGDNYYYNLIFEPSSSVAGLYGGYQGPGSKTIIPNEVTAKIDFRLVPDQTPEDIIAKIKKHLVKNGFEDAEVISFGSLKPSRTPIDNEYVPVMSRAIATAWGDEPIIFPNIGGAGPNYIFQDVLETPSAVIPFAPFNQNNHSPDECMTVSGYYNGIRTAAALIEEMAKTKK
ncbi:MAG: M20/M25/M40 family metallo-hydrolase [Bacteroidaceae bacterium]|nr:M20/M25/M40 family metallo-hydrolase [Bacteroidaceae bacterium]